MRQLRTPLLGLILAVLFGVRLGNQTVLPATASTAARPTNSKSSLNGKAPAVGTRTAISHAHAGQGGRIPEDCGAPGSKAAGETAATSGGSMPCALPLPAYWKALCELNPGYPREVGLPAAADLPAPNAIEKRGVFASQCLGAEVNKVLFVLASVPDPIHTHLGTFFDREIDAIQVAASQAEFLPYSHSFPWPPPQRGAQTGLDGGNASESSGPGVLILRKQGKPFSQADPPGQFDYLAVLLIPELPTRGLSREAFFDAKGVMDVLASDKKNIWLAGPSFSGSVASLGDLANGSASASCIQAFSGSVANPPDRPDPPESMRSGVCPPKLHLLQTKFPQALQEFVVGAKAFGYRADQIALLTEEGTKYGSLQFEMESEVLLFNFPREISKLRNAYGTINTQPSQPSSDSSTEGLTLQWQDPQGSDADDLPDYGAQTQISQQAVLANISTSLRVHGIKVLGIIATNPMDTAFLLRSLKQSVHDVRFLLRDPDLLYLRTPDIGSLNGTLLLSNSPLIPQNQDWSGIESDTSGPDQAEGLDTDHLITFASATQEGEYNAFIELLEKISDQPGKLRRLEWNLPCGHLNRKEAFLQKEGKSPCSTKPGVDGDPIPPLWLATIGTAGHFPLILLPEDKEIGSKLHLDSLSIGKPLYTPWLLWLTVVATGILHLCGLVFHRKLPGRYKYDFQISEATKVGPVKGACHLIAILCLALAQWILGSGYVFFRNSVHGDNDSSPAYRWMFWLVMAATILFLGSAGYIFRILYLQQKRAAGLLFPVVIFVGAGIWWGVAVLPRTLQNAFLHFRDLNLISGVAPALPLAFLILVFYVGIWAFFLRLAYWQYRYAGFRNMPLDDFIDSNFSQSTEAIDRCILGRFKNVSWKKAFWATFISCLVMYRPWLFPMDMLEPRGVRSLVTLFVCLVLLALWLNWFRFLGMWLSLQEVLNRLETLPIKDGFNRMPHENSLPIWQWRSSDSCFILRQVVDRLRALEKISPNIVSGVVPAFNTWIAAQRSLDTVKEEEKEKHVKQVVDVLVLWLKANYWNRGSAGNYQNKTQAPPAPAGDNGFVLAEDIVVLPFYDYIRHVVIELRNLLFFIVVAFCLLFGALHVYAFGADSAIDWSMIALFIVLGAGVIAVLAQMERNPLLRRLADGGTGGLGKTFYFDLLKYGTVPLLTVLSSQLPFISNNVLRWLQPAVEALR